MTSSASNFISDRLAGGEFGLGLAFGLVADVCPINVRAKLFAGDAATCGSLNFNAALCRYRPKSLRPLVHCWSGHLKQSGQCRLRPNQVASAFNRRLFMHGQSVALLHTNIKPCFTSSRIASRYV